MKILVIGSGGREHAICWKIAQSPLVTKLYCAPGNPGVSQLADLVDLPADDIEGLASFAQRCSVDLTIVGPELPLSLGIVDLFRKHGLAIFGPSQAAAALESSKSFAKEVMLAAGVPTAAYARFESGSDAAAYLTGKPAPFVIKGDGLAAGKGVFICETVESARAALDTLFSEMGMRSVVVEEYLEGVEASFIVATDGERIVPLASSHDYKRIGEGDTGHNTGGMGTVSPTPRLSPEQEVWAVESVIRPVLNEMSRRGTSFAGFLYAGLMITPAGEINVLEFNVRLGDPETQVILRRLNGDLLILLNALATGGSLGQLSWSHESAVCVVLASAGYPESSSKGDVIMGLNEAEGMPEVVVFHAGTSRNASGEIVTGGGRVLNVTALGESLGEARQRAYAGCSKIEFNGRQIRRDIAA